MFYKKYYNKKNISLWEGVVVNTIQPSVNEWQSNIFANLACIKSGRRAVINLILAKYHKLSRQLRREVTKYNENNQKLELQYVTRECWWCQWNQELYKESINQSIIISKPRQESIRKQKFKKIESINEWQLSQGMWNNSPLVYYEF